MIARLILNGATARRLGSVGTGCAAGLALTACGVLERRNAP